MTPKVHPGAVAAFSRFRRRDISDFTYLLTYLLTYLFGSVNRRLAWQLYNRDLYRHKDDISVICELLAVKHGDIELDLFSNSVLVAFIEFLCTK